MTLLELYQSQSAAGKMGEQSRLLLEQTHWFTVNADFDPKTGEALPQALSVFLAKIARPRKLEAQHDRLWRITNHARPSVERLFRALSENPRREHALLPVRAVRELDAGSFIKLSNRPGRNIREKLAGKPYLQAVRRYQSVNLPENRLFKAFVTHLAELLVLRQDCLGESEDELLPKIQSWLISDEAGEIARWDNLPPNNTLLSHRDYRCIWDAWCRLQTLDEDIARDLSQLEIRAKTMCLWDEYGCMYSDGTHRFAEMPLFFDYDTFEMVPWVSEKSDGCLRLPPHLIQKAKWKISRSLTTKDISKPACVDLAVLRPRYASANDSALHSLYEAYLWQEWKFKDKSVDIELFNSDAAYLHPDATTISFADVFFSKDNAHIERASRAFASELRKVFKNDSLIWLVPDFLNDFEIEAVRRNLNALFPGAEPLPRSVAAVFEQINYSKIKRAGYTVVVVDTIGGKTCVTKLIARSDPELKKHLPQTNGYYWERCPEVIIPPDATEKTGVKIGPNYDLPTVDSQGSWRAAVPPEQPAFEDQNVLRRDPRIGQFDDCINLTQSPVVGGIRLHVLQQRAGDIPLWRYQIPELSIKGYIDGLYRRFSLVGKHTTVAPIRGKPVAIEIKAEFPLPAGKPFYSFPLYRGENADELGFSARLESPAFPLKTATVCKLNLTFEYGANEPYILIFEPQNKSFPPIRATWRSNEEVIITDALAPGYPAPMRWDDLRRMPNRNGETIDLLERVSSGIDRLDRALFIRPQKRTTGEIIRHWRADRNEKHYTLAHCDEYASEVFIHENNLVHGLCFEDFEEGDKVSFELEAHKGKFIGYRVARADYKEDVRHRELDADATDALVTNIYRWLYFPFIHVWADGRTITDTSCPEDFAASSKNDIAYFAKLVCQPEIPKTIKNRFLFLLACLHKDTTDSCVQWITEQVESRKFHNPRAIGFGLGDVSEKWQKYLFSSLVSNPNASTISIFAYAIWREEHFIERLSISDLQAILDSLLSRLMNIRPLKLKVDEQDKKRAIRSWVRATVEPLELLLGLLRTRVSTNEEIRMLLQPHQKITKELARQVERVTEIVADSKVQLFSRVQLNIPKPAGDRTPDLIYALRLYLTNDDGANAIHITSVSDDDND